MQGWRWEWAREVREVVFALDAAAAGQQQWRALARQAARQAGGGAAASGYEGYKDMNEAWTAGRSCLGAWPVAVGLEVPEELREVWAERVAIMAAGYCAPCPGSS